MAGITYYVRYFTTSYVRSAEFRFSNLPRVAHKFRVVHRAYGILTDVGLLLLLSCDSWLWAMIKKSKGAFLFCGKK